MDVFNTPIVVFAYEPNVWCLNETLLACAGRFQYSPISLHLSPEGEAWGDSLYRYLETNPDEPFMMLLEDYKIVDTDATLLLEAQALAKHQGIGCVRLLPCPGPKGETRGNFGPIHPADRYSVSLQASIWRGSALKTVIKPGDSPWDAEIKGGMRYAASPAYRTECAIRNAVSYDNLMRMGQPTAQAAKKEV